MGRGTLYLVPERLCLSSRSLMWWPYDPNLKSPHLWSWTRVEGKSCNALQTVEPRLNVINPIPQSRSGLIDSSRLSFSRWKTDSWTLLICYKAAKVKFSEWLGQDVCFCVFQFLEPHTQHTGLSTVEDVGGVGWLPKWPDSLFLFSWSMYQDPSTVQRWFPTGHTLLIKSHCPIQWAEKSPLGTSILDEGL